MLLAVALDDRARFDSVWSWTRENLQRKDGLLAFRWAGRRGGFRATRATDADLDAARALVLAAERFDDEDYRREGVRIGDALLEQETAAAGELPVLVAGPWARPAPPVVNPSYLSPRAYADLAAAQPDDRWDGLAASGRALVAAMTADGSLPSDWARVVLRGRWAERRGRGQRRADRRPGRAHGAGRPEERAVSGLDAVRTPVRFAESCVSDDRRVAARMWPRYAKRPGRAAYDLDGAPAGEGSHAASLVAAAAAASAADHEQAGEKLLDRATALDERHPSYYGAAWVALGRVMLSSPALGECLEP